MVALGFAIPTLVALVVGIVAVHLALTDPDPVGLVLPRLSTVALGSLLAGVTLLLSVEGVLLPYERPLSFVLAVPQHALIGLVGDPYTLGLMFVGFFSQFAWSYLLAIVIVESVERVHQWPTDTPGDSTRR